MSPSSIDRFRVCSHQFLLADLERRPRIEQANEALVVGNAVHAALALFYSLRPEARTPENLERALRHLWPNHRRRTSFLSRQHEAACGRRALDMLARYAATADLAVEPVAREETVRLRLGGVVVSGKIDRVDWAEPGEAARKGGIVVRDYKTSAAGAAAHFGDASELKSDVACQIYVLGAEARFGHRVVAVSFFYLATGEELRLEVDDEVRENLRRRLVRHVEAVQSETEFAANLGEHCHWCPVARHCDARRAAVEIEQLVPVEGLPF